MAETLETTMREETETTPGAQSVTSDAETERSGAFKYWMFRILSAVVPRTPGWLARPLFMAGGWLAWAFAAGLRRRAEWNLSHIPSLAANPALRRRTARAAFITLALNYWDFFRGRGLSDAELNQGWDIPDLETLARVAALGKGVIVLTAHYGPFEHAAWKLGLLGLSMITPAERLKPERFHQLVTFIRNHHGARLAAGDDRETLREVIAALRRGEVVVFAVDRYVMGPAAPYPFFGTEAKLPIAPFALAARSDAPVMLLASRRAGGNRQTGVIETLTPERTLPAQPRDSNERQEQPAKPQERVSRDEAVARMRARAYPALERLIADDPGQWVSVLSPIWDEPATMN